MCVAGFLHISGEMKPPVPWCGNASTSSWSLTRERAHVRIDRRTDRSTDIAVQKRIHRQPRRIVTAIDTGALARLRKLPPKPDRSGVCCAA
jgi:hypothetical protein